MTKKPMDIDDISTGDITSEILHPVTEEPVGIRVTLMASTDKRLTSIKRQIQNENLKRQNRRKTIKASEVEENENALLAATIVSWDWYNAVYKGEKPDCTPKMIKEIFVAKPWFRQAINDLLEAEADFFTT